MTAAHLPGDEGLDDRVPFLARLESEDRSALLSLGHELSFAPRMVLLHQSEPSSHVLIVTHGWTKVTRRPPTVTRRCSRCADRATSSASRRH